MDNTITNSLALNLLEWLPNWIEKGSIKYSLIVNYAHKYVGYIYTNGEGAEDMLIYSEFSTKPFYRAVIDLTQIYFYINDPESDYYIENIKTDKDERRLY
jgi:hypothetical protein